MLQKYITGSYYRITSRNDIMKLYHGIIFMNRTSGMPGTSPEPPGIPGIPWAHPWDPRGRPWDPWASPWDSQRRPWDHPGTPPRPWDPWGRPGHVPEPPQLGPSNTSNDSLWTTKMVIPLQIYTARSCVRSCPSGPIA